MKTSEPIVTSLNHVIGQQRAVTVLRTALDAYWHDRSKSDGKEAFPHLLMCGPGGTGKTLLTELIARELCTCLLYTSPSPRDRQKSRMPSSA